MFEGMILITKKNFMKDAFGTMIDVSVGGATMNMVSNSSMPQPYKDLTNTGIGLGIVGKTFGKMKKHW